MGSRAGAIDHCVSLSWSLTQDLGQVSLLPSLVQDLDE